MNTYSTKRIKATRHNNSSKFRADDSSSVVFGGSQAQSFVAIMPQAFYRVSSDNGMITVD
jgi:hypothetical protein